MQAEVCRVITQLSGLIANLERMAKDVHATMLKAPRPYPRMGFSTGGDMGWSHNAATAKWVIEERCHSLQFSRGHPGWHLIVG